ncbi:NRPS-like enzyme [Penicillium longicatenatum]|uniref:NRPS-like enzyme n=1 Tax=Penicillium longicatenatum TaxID=1561947 RepID=UPI0025481C8C|nr:NRPS-like enzyme [Penicillium longicatenatum]KAJ5660931.1 NRPS-like enzyme [Penicillium longicatenatum]
MGSAGIQGRLLTQILDDLAQKSPSSLYCIHPTSQASDNDWCHISVQQFAQAVDRLAWWIDHKLGGQKEQQVLAYIGTNDLRYGAFILACMKLGHATLLLSTRNSQEAQRHLLQSTKCSILVDGIEKAQLQHQVDDLEANSSDVPFDRWKIDSMWDVFSSSPVPPCPHSVQFADVEDLPAVIIHSSGTTGNPKPITVTHGYLATLDNLRALPVPSGRQSCFMFHLQQGKLRFYYSPFFHFMGLVCISECLFYQTPFLLTPDRPLTTKLFTRIMNMDYAPTWGLFNPYALEELAGSEEGLRALKKLSAVNYGGAPMGQATGEKLTSVLRLQTIIGSSETAYTPALLCVDPADWSYHEWNPAFELRMEDTGEGLWELVLPRPKQLYFHGIFHSHPHLDEYRTGDLFRPHPSKPGLWKYDGRGDDILVLSNGEKFNPIEAEKLIESHTFVRHAAIFGRDRFQAALLIELNWEELPPSWTPNELKRTIWPVVEQGNELLPAHGKVLESHIAFSSQDRPFTLSPKGTLRRRDIAKTYETVLDGLYHPEGTNAQSSKHVEEVPGTQLSEIREWIQDQIAQILAQDAIGSNTDLAALGMDSLQTVRLVQVLQLAEDKLHVNQKNDNWTSAMVYDLETIPLLAQTLYKRIHGSEPESDSTKPSISSREDTLIKSIWQQAQFLGSGGLTVVLTGSTGELGSYILDMLLKDPSITQIYCLNRSADAAERQVMSFEKKQLSSTWLTETSRVQFWLSSLGEEYLGLTPEKYDFLEQNVDIVMHNSWLVNFNQPIANFETHIIGVRRLLKLIENSSHNANFHFVSSVSTVLGQPMPSGSPIPEGLPQMTGPLRQGYGESKYVGENLCQIASERNRSQIAIHRVGQLGGPSNPEAGMWNMRDWLPSLVWSSQTMRKLPDSLGPFQVDWLPIDVAARIMTEIVRNRRDQTSSALAIYHITNPKIAQWESLTGLVAKACGASIVSLEEWVQSLEHLVSSGDVDLHKLPAAGLLDFFRMLVTRQSYPMPSMDVANTQAASLSLREMGPVDERLMETWLRQWKEVIPELAI